MPEEMESVIDFSGVDFENMEKPPLLPEGEYPGTLSDAEIRTSQNSGNKYLSLRFNISPEDFPPDFDGPDNGINVNLNFAPLDPTNKRAMWRLRTLLKSLDIPFPKGELSSSEVKGWVGATGTIQIRHENDLQGEPVERVARVVSTD